MFFLIIYLGLCFGLAQWAKATRQGSWMTFLISFFFTPLAGLGWILLGLVVDHDVNEAGRNDKK